MENYLEIESAQQNHLVAPLFIGTAARHCHHGQVRPATEAYAKSLQMAGVRIRLKRFGGVVHEFFGLAGAVAKAKEGLKFVTAGIKEAFDAIEKLLTNWIEIPTHYGRGWNSNGSKWYLCQANCHTFSGAINCIIFSVWEREIESCSDV
jgi:hypothetical protein